MKRILPGHGSGGRLMNDLILNTIRSRFGSDTLQLDDAAVLAAGPGRIAFTTDTFTITPVFFPGGDIGKLAVNGTVNDLAVMGATPIALSCALIIEEGFPIEDLERILDSMAAEAKKAGVRIVTGDTKVVPHGKADGIFINTSGIGTIAGDTARRDIRPGDRIIISGTIGDHGMAVMATRQNLSFAGNLRSDCAHLNHLIAGVLKRHGGDVRFMRDPTRGGVASVLNEIVAGAGISAMLSEEDLPVTDEVRGLSDILGIDPLYSANEGKVLMVADPSAADDIVALMRTLEHGEHARVIGTIDTEFPGKAYLATSIGGRRILPLLTEEQLPRIC
jgi:hydrogenase expression/formation protein HypE